MANRLQKNIFYLKKCMKKYIDANESRILFKIQIIYNLYLF
jgi:lipoprotein NlpI